VTVRGEANLDRIKDRGPSTFACRRGNGGQQKKQVEVTGFEQGLDLILSWYTEQGVISRVSDIEAVGFKTVLAGPGRGACRLSDEVIEEMRRYAYVAPAHNLPYIETISLFRERLGAVPLVGVFEHSFHERIPRYRKVNGLPAELEDRLGLLQRGFHGATGRYGAERVRLMHGEHVGPARFPAPFRLIYNHLGGSSSTHAIMDGTSVATSMRLSLQTGHFQSTRVGDLDPFVPLYIMEKEGCSHERMREIMSHESGLLGMAGIGSGEMSDILEAANGGDDRAETAVCAFVDRVRQYIGAYSAVLCGVDAIAFAGGIGENGVELRERICEGFEYLGVEIDRERNRSSGGLDFRISSDSSRVGVYVVRTNEELVVAYFTKGVVRKGQDLAPEEMNFRLGKDFFTTVSGGRD